MADRLLDAGFDEEEIHTMAVTNTRRAGAGRRHEPPACMVIGAHSADFVWRAGGAVAVAVERGGTAEVVALSYGERGESGELWKQEGQTVENVKSIRHDEAEARGGGAGRDFRCLDLGDYPLQIDADALIAIADAIRAFAPDVLITHTDRDPFNPDHPVASVAVDRARGAGRGRGRAERLRHRSLRRPCSCSSPTSPSCATSPRRPSSTSRPVFERKRAAMAEMKAQSYLQTYYAQRAEQRANHARRASGNASVRYAEAFQRVIPQVVSEL